MVFRRNTDPDPEPDPERFQSLMVDGEPDFDDLLSCVFGITEPVAETYQYLLANPESTVKELAETMECDRSNVNRKLDRLREKGLATRNRSILNTGGHVYQYTPLDLDETQTLMHRTLDEWTAAMHEQIDERPENMNLDRKKVEP